MQKRGSESRPRHPWLWDDRRFNHPAQPVTGLCWYEAQAYAAWLNNCLSQSKRLPDGWQVCLPSEAHWEKAARGSDTRLYPWGNRWSLDRCNSLESRLMAPSPVMMYPNGASAYGVLDLAGNVWEWCQDRYFDKEYQQRSGSVVTDPLGPDTGDTRVVRGGAWLMHRDSARCASRLGVEPDGFSYPLGFRVVLSPIKPLDS